MAAEEVQACVPGNDEARLMVVPVQQELEKFRHRCHLEPCRCPEGPLGEKSRQKSNPSDGKFGLLHVVPSQGGSLVARKALPWLRHVYRPWWSQAGK